MTLLGSFLYLSTCCEKSKVEQSGAGRSQQRINGSTVPARSVLSGVSALVSSGGARNLVSIRARNIMEGYQTYAKEMKAL